MALSTSIVGKAARRGKRHTYSHATHRLREIEKIIRDRHGTVPDTDDADAYILPAALCLRQLATDRGRAPSADLITKQILFWCEQWARPHLDSVRPLVSKISKMKRGIGTADQLGKKLRLSDVDRTRLGIRTIGAYDVDRKAREKRRRAKKQARDREHARAKRAAEGAVTRSEYIARSLSQAKPWEALGISRRTYERRRSRRKFAS